MQMSYDIVLATRNRQTILKISLPLMLSQGRLPRRFIVVDASDDHREVCDVVKHAFHEASATAELQIVESRPGSSLQRNIGLRHVESPVVIFPDDDVLWFPDLAENVMRIYERDKEELIGCVASTPSSVYPAGSFGSDGPPYVMEVRDRLSRRIHALVGPLEDRLIPDPIDPGSMWMKVWGAKVCPAWLAQEGAELCGPVFGYRMSFRTSVIRRIGGFDQRLGRYAMFEDSDATLGALCQRLNALATRAAVYHHRMPGERVSGLEFGMMAILNRAYVVCKHSPPGSVARRILRKYLRYKIVRYAAQSYSRYGRKRLKGALFGILRLGEILNAPVDQLANRYLHLRESIIQNDRNHCADRATL
jgi:glycosyltransferase involved in cell wall biosynthesis